MSLQVDQLRQELLESVREAEKHIREQDMEARNFNSDWDYQDALHGADILESAAGEEFQREEEEALQTTGAGHLIEPEDLWKALCWKPEFRAIRDQVISEMMDAEKFRAAAREFLEAEAKDRMEP